MRRLILLALLITGSCAACVHWTHPLPPGWEASALEHTGGKCADNLPRVLWVSEEQGDKICDKALGDLDRTRWRAAACIYYKPAPIIYLIRGRSGTLSEAHEYAHWVRRCLKEGGTNADHTAPGWLLLVYSVHDRALTR